MRSKRRIAGIQSPQLPAAGLSEISVDETLRDGSAFSQCLLASSDFSEQEADDVLFEQAHLKRVSLARTHLTSSQMLDTRCDTCDFAGAEWEKAHLSRIEFTGCRLVGLKLMASEITDAVIRDCNAEFALFWSSSFKAARFERCNLSGASFTEADLSGVVFKDCDLSNADFTGAKLVGTDLRGSKVEGLKVGIKELQGAIIEPGQAVHIVGLLGIEVKWEE
ncbi:MAG TPA: pentapeptide repeat-containing protein [Herpetosiphonaceae bacterium]